MNIIEKNLNNILVFFTFLSIVSSKAGVNISLGLLLISLTITIFIRHKENTKLTNNKIDISFYSIFSLGCFISFIQHYMIDDLLYFISKAGFLLVTPQLVYLLQRNKSSKIAIRGLSLGAFIGILIMLEHLSSVPINHWFSTRVTGPWDVTRWSKILAFIMAFSLPYLFTVKHKTSLIIATVILFIAILLSGTRAPMLALTISSLLFLLFNHRKTLLFIVVFSAIGFISLQNSILFENLTHRVESISNTTTNNSNTARLLIWKKGLEFFDFNLNHNPKLALLGNGKNHIAETFYSYLNSTTDINELQKSVGNQFSYSDSHNAYISNLNQMGLIFAILYFLFFIYLFIFFVQNINNQPLAAWSGINMLITLAICGIFNADQIELETTAFFFILSIPLSICLTTKKGGLQKC